MWSPNLLYNEIACQAIDFASLIGLWNPSRFQVSGAGGPDGFFVQGIRPPVYIMDNKTNSSELDIWHSFHFFLGTWQGSGTGKPGHSQVTSTYALILQDRFIQVQDMAIYPPQERNPNGEIH
jgi:hypothetical protein